MTYRPILALEEYKLKVVNNICEMHGYGARSLEVVADVSNMYKLQKSAITLLLGNIITSEAKILV